MKTEDIAARMASAYRQALIREALRDLRPRLDQNDFVPVHRSTKVNLRCVRAAVRSGDGKLRLELEGSKLSPVVSRIPAHLFRPR